MTWWFWLIVALSGVFVYALVGTIIYGLMESRLDPRVAGTLDDWSAPFALFWPIWCVVAPIVWVLKRVFEFAAWVGNRIGE